MKRSEAVQRLILWAKSHETLYFKPIDEQWDEVLRFIEEQLGMAPPSVPTLTVFETVIREERIWEEENG